MNISGKSLFIFLGNVLLFLCLTAAGWFLYLKINTESGVIADASAQIALLQEKEREFDESSSNIIKYDAEIQKLKGAFLTEASFVEFLRATEELAKKAEVKFKAVNAVLPTGNDDRAALTFELEGGKIQLVRFFILLDKIPYSGMVEKMQWTRQGKVGDIVKVSADYQIFNYAK
ncbi:hypothetical protein A2662_00185 [Candidatus Giovannonibacteria bacterium RIFCSPHIGHO2_01_FULL_45_33]|uniref:Uncharacterized protein n=1 Tax=Candidatus Giovannonibacteria bacterium RIFCSPLOWO2_01_FULL_45_34 TaxID=1798351 RepID=A0A1F5X0M5_9BACT|nr:MAG: hypothetical protein A2662_00185 [Candidatus Giovannonibacteria bacterium RIFCSPHIGHO2_01_FULL_45_33]OGF81458.1 MAG: hypothetical protein A2930_04410 [Candidatus Giovannonibacteria bacterium RIFCSPLOWO2_01_FULL_45_34]